MKTPIPLLSKRPIYRSIGRKYLLPKPITHTTIGSETPSAAIFFIKELGDPGTPLGCDLITYRKFNTLGQFQMTSRFTFYNSITNTISQ